MWDHKNTVGKNVKGDFPFSRLGRKAIPIAMVSMSVRATATFGEWRFHPNCQCRQPGGKAELSTVHEIGIQTDPIWFIQVDEDKHISCRHWYSPRLSCTLHLQIGVKRATNCNRKSWEKKLCLEFSCRLSISGQLKGGIYILRPCTSMNSFGAWLSAHSASCQKPRVFSRTERAMLWRNLIQPSPPFQVFSSQPQVLNMARC